MTEPNNTPEFDPATDADAPVEETAPVDPVEVTPEAPMAPESETTEASNVPDPDAPDLDAAPVSGVPSSPAAVSDVPVQTDNSEREEDGAQDVSQDPTEVPSTDEDPDVVA